MISESHMVREGLLFRPIQWEQVEKIVLIGFRGAGKSLMAQQVAAELGWKVISTDAQIEKQVGCAITEFVAKKGWLAFRKVESQVVHQLEKLQGVIIDTGGGVVEQERNMVSLIPRSLVIWVDAPVAVLVKRLEKSSDRPLLSRQSWEADVQEHYHRRQPLYRKYAHLYVDTSRPETKEMVLTFIRQLGKI